jgi:hypothetical protein
MSDEVVLDTGTAPEAEVPQESVPEPRKYKVKVDDTEEEVDEEELLKGYQKAKSSDKRFQEASQLRKEAQATNDLLRQIRENPDLLEQLGIDLDGYSEKRLLKQLERSLKTPEELELEEYRTEKQKREAASKQREEEAAAHRASEEIDAEISQVLQQSGLNPTPRLIARLAEQMLATMTPDGDRMKAADAFQRVRRDYAQDVSELLENLTPEQLAAEYPSLVKKLRSHSISQAQQKAVPSFKAGSTPKPSSEDKSAKRKSIDDWLK